MRLTVADDKGAVDHLENESGLVGEHGQLPFHLSNHVCLTLGVHIESQIEEFAENVLGAVHTHTHTHTHTYTHTVIFGNQ